MFFLYILFCLLPCTINCRFKSIPDNQPVTKVEASFPKYLIKSNIVSDDLRKAWQTSCMQNKSTCKNFPIAFAGIMRCACSRSSLSDLQAIVNRLNSGTATVEDFQTAEREWQCYGEARLEKDTLKITDPEGFPFKFDANNTSYLNVIFCINAFGTDSGWSKEKIDQETEQFLCKVTESLVKQSQKTK